MRHQGLVLSLMVTLATACAALVFAAAGSAHSGHVQTGVFGSFGNVQGIAVDESTGSVYVLDSSAGGSIFKFNATGEPAEFSALNADVIAGVGASGPDENELAVDNSSGPAKGDIYLANGSHIAIYGSDGLSVGELDGTVAGPWGEPCGVAVDSAGNVYVGLWPTHVNKYHAATEGHVTNADYTESLSELSSPCNIGVGSSSVYTVKWSSGPVTGYAFSQFGAASAIGDVVDEAGSTLAFDPVKNVLYVNETGQVAAYDSTNALRETFGSATGYGIAVNGATGDIYTADTSTGNSIKTFKEIILPDVKTTAPSDVQEGSITFKGTINPDGLPTSTCEFQYFAAAHSTVYDHSVPCAASPGTGKAPVEVDARIAGLTPNEYYRYRLVASNTNGTEEGQGEILRIPSPPSVGGLTVTDLAPGAATISGNVGSGGRSSTYRIDLGTDTSYGTQSTGEIAGSSQTVSMMLLYLEPSTTYHYEITVTSEDGAASSGDQTFTTPAYPILLPQVLPQIAAPSIAFPVEKAASKVKPKHKTTKNSKHKNKSKRKHKKKK